MQSHQSFFGENASKSFGHQRRASLGKSMPVTSLLLNFPPLTSWKSRDYSSLSRDGISPEHDTERPPLFFQISPEPPLNVKSNTIEDDNNNSADDEKTKQYEQDYEILVSDYSGSEDDDEEKVSLIGNSMFYRPCLTCTKLSDNDDPAKVDKGEMELSVDEMCKKLCTEECRRRRRRRHYPRRTLHTRSTAILERDRSESPPALPERPHSTIANERKKFLTNMLRSPSSSSLSSDDDDNVPDTDSKSAGNKSVNPELFEIVSSIVADGDVDDNGDNEDDDDHACAGDNCKRVDPHERAMLKDFREKFAIAEALAKTSAMTSTTAVKQRLAARKVEMELDGGGSGGGGNDDAAISVTSEEQSAAARQTNQSATQAFGEGDDNVGSEYEPPRDLLLYLVRMGSFNSAPKINNIDSQDDALELPKNLGTSELLEHVRHLRGENQPPLLARYFLKPTLLSPSLVSNDITDGLRYLKLNSVSRICSPPDINSPNHIRLLQWNILSQTLGQHNDGFVRCPEEALKWDHRKFLIIQEILQNNPDIICLQEVDHFKFLQKILGTQNYAGIFFPKPDSPCLYIEENNGPDGCAIFFKCDKFELKNYDTRILEVWRVQSNQVAIAANFEVKATGKEICVCTTHLKARHGSLLSKLRNEQGRDLIQFVKEFADKRPLLMCGDFNAEPIEPVYSTILNFPDLKLSSAYADINDDSTNSDSNNGYRLYGKISYAEKCASREPPYTTWKIREEGEVCHTIDYVFYSKDKLKVKNCLDFPPGDEIGKDRTPSFQYPSDHFSLICDFEILENVNN